MTNDKPTFTVFQRKGSVGWIVKYKDAAGEWRMHRCPPEVRTKRQAVIYAAAWLDELQRLGTRPEAPVTPKPDRGPTLNELRDKWLERRANRGKKLRTATVSGDASILDNHILPRIGSVPVKDLGPGRMRRFLLDLNSASPMSKKRPLKRNRGKETEAPTADRGLAPHTIRNIANTLTTMLDDAIALEWVESMPNHMKNKAVRDELPKARTRAGRNVIIHMNLDHAGRLIACEAVPEVRRVRYVVGFTSGMRDGEISALTFADLDLDAEIPTVDVNKSLAMKGEGGWASIGETKTEDANRKIPLHTLAVRSLRAWKAGGWVQLVGRHPKPADPVFPVLDALGKPQPHRPKSSTLIRTDLEAAGLPTLYAGKHNIDFHATRRSFATWLNAADVPESRIKRLMGHAAEGVTEKHYNSVELSKLQEAIQTIKLDVSTGDVVELPMKVAVNDTARGIDDPNTDDQGTHDATSDDELRFGHGADLGAGRTKGRTKNQQEVSKSSGAIHQTRTDDLRFTNAS
jgi:integrase